MKALELTPEGHGSFGDGKAWSRTGAGLRSCVCGEKRKFTTPSGTAEKPGPEAKGAREASCLQSVMIGPSREMSAISLSPMVKETGDFAHTRTRDGKEVS